MKRALVVAVLTMTVAMSCLIDRRSSEFECEQDSDCDDIDGNPRECSNDGFCTLLDCPSICDGGCGANKTCTILCSNASECRTGVDCPSGFSCVINCTQDCTPVDCRDGCVVNCSGNADCGPIDCGGGETCSCVPTGGTCL